ncbi:ribonuclease H-like domain-containing protein [Mycena pura]|uniref:Ribonuclease H-like domain-containing protein n=1 Tax=Mycena pura TaxID=153505 RepID=A0AAD6V6A2_9AGAR|nr:ribonuclease H-like domain-containing protein [Mycena pura]
MSYVPYRSSGTALTHGRTDGWRSDQKDAVGGVALTYKFKSLLIDIIRTNKLKKDGESMQRQFAKMIEDAEREWACRVIAFLTDNDGGSKSGRNRLGAELVWLLIFPCCAHQGQLILGDYIKENPEAKQLIGELIDAVVWINSHDKVRAIFDERQQVTYGKTLAYLLPNLTRWTTHLVAAIRFDALKVPIRAAILNERDAIVAAQVGAERNTQKRKALEKDAEDHCNILEPNAWWDRLHKKIIPDLEHICYLTNISQSDSVRPDQFLLALAGLFLHFHGFSARETATERALGKRMCARIEKRWKELDQVVFLLALILNPFEGLSRFGPKAKINIFDLSTLLTTLYKRMRSRPPATPRTETEEVAFTEQLNREAQAINTAFIARLSGTGEFRSWNEDDTHRSSYKELHGDDPIPFYEMLQTNPQLALFARFALTLLRLVVNQAGLERWFSDFSNKKNKKRNRLGLKKMAQQAKVTRRIREEQYVDGLAAPRDGRKNHKDAAALLFVPRYAEANLSDTDASDSEGEKQSVIIKSSAGWRKQVGEWQREAQELDALDPLSEQDEEGAEEFPDVTLQSARQRGSGRRRAWLPATLESLFAGGAAPSPIQLKRRERVVTEEGRLMELLQAVHSEEEPDDGAREGSGDDYEE